VDLSEPGRGLAGGLTMPILRALSTRSTPATAAQVERVAGDGTAAGIRRALERLAEHGVCVREEAAGRSVYSLNYDHVLYPAVQALLAADGVLVLKLRSTLRRWELEPRCAVLFGSAARGDGDTGSDVDVLLIRPARTAGADRQLWARQVHELRDRVHRLTGNRLQVLDWTYLQLLRHDRAGEPIIGEMLRDGVRLHGTDLAAVLERAS
jgi:predicted nucleotidyltransferase